MASSPGRTADSPAPHRLTQLETPFFFTASDRPIYAVYHAPQRARAGAPVIVHCHSLGVEQLTCYRSEVECARAAAASGFPVLRYHARGHGDSAGDFADVTLASLADDAVAAVHEARKRSGAERVILLGVRFGALVAAYALGRCGSVAGLVLWEPVLRPASYFRDMLRGVLFSKVAHGQRPDTTLEEMLDRVERDGRANVHGYYLHRALMQSARDRELTAALADWAGPTLMVQIQSRPRLATPAAALASVLEGRGAPVATALIQEEPGWHFITNPAWHNEQLVDLTVEWLDALA